jgi:subtilisin family serine protease
MLGPLFVLCLLSAVVHARQPSVRHDFAPTGMHALAAIQSSWIIGVTHWHSQTALDTVALAVPLARDGCYLLRSNADTLYILLEIYCESESERPLSHAVEWLAERYGAANVQAERNVPMRNGLFWYGNTVNMQEMLYATSLPARHRMTKAYRRKMDAAFVQTGATWGLDRIDQHGGLLNGQYDYDTLGQDVDVYIVDTGLLVNHTQFGGRASFYYNSVDLIDTDCLGHGTHVAGIVGSALYGVAKGVHLIGIKVLDCTGTGSTFTIIDGLRAVLERIAQTGRRSVINLSLGGDRSPVLESALLAIASMNNTAVVVAAGNEGADACLYSPSALGQAGNVLVVGASDYTDTRPWWSNTGACVDLSAPGLSILSTWIGSSNSATAVLSGTSMASPFVAGVAALVLQMNPSLDITQVNTLITSQSTPNVINGATLLGGGRRLLYSLVDAEAAVAPTAPSVPYNPPPVMQQSGAVRQAGAYFALPFLLLYLVAAGAVF